MTQYDGDVRLHPTPDGGAIFFEGGQPAMDSGLQTAVYLSLFTAPDWWAASLLPVPVGSVLAEPPDEPLTNATRLEAIEAARDALAWMIDKGLAESIVVSAEITAPGVLALSVEITEPGASTPQTLRYRLNWAAESAYQEAL